MSEDARGSRDIRKGSDLANERARLHYGERNRPICRFDDNTDFACPKQVGGIAWLTLTDQAGAILDRYNCTGTKKRFKIVLGELPQQWVRGCETKIMQSTLRVRHFAIGKTHSLERRRALLIRGNDMWC